MCGVKDHVEVGNDVLAAGASKIFTNVAPRTAVMGRRRFRWTRTSNSISISGGCLRFPGSCVRSRNRFQDWLESTSADLAMGSAAMDQAIVERIIDIIAEQALLNSDQITPQSTLDELGIDSWAWSSPFSQWKKVSIFRFLSTRMIRALKNSTFLLSPQLLKRLRASLPRKGISPA